MWVHKKRYICVKDPVSVIETCFSLWTGLSPRPRLSLGSGSNMRRGPGRRAAVPSMWSAVVCLLCHFTQLSWKAAGQKREPLLLFQTPTVSSTEAFKPPPQHPHPPTHIYIYIFFFLISIYFFIMSTFYWVDLWRTFTRNCFFFSLKIVGFVKRLFFMCR